MDDAFKFVEADGLCLENAYPYKGTDGTCAMKTCTSEVKITGFTDIKKGSTADLLTACATKGPISIAVDANFRWQMYSKGIFDHNCNENKLDHGVLLVGYEEGSYWKVKNSWGESWGENDSSG